MSCTPSEYIKSTISGKQKRIRLTFVGLMHEFEQLIDDCFEELPVRFKESRILSNDVHDIGCDDGFVVFAPLDLAQT
jgi:hypothetical protein